MKNKKLKRWILLLCIIIGGGTVYSFATHASQTIDSDIFFSQWGAYTSEKNDEKKEQKTIKQQLYAQGKNTVVTMEEIEQGIKFYELQGISRDTAEKNAYEFFKKDAVVNYQAIIGGFTVTDEEVAAYIDEMKTIYHGDEIDEDSKTAFAAMITSFGSEDAYWESTKETSKEMLTASAYRESWEKKYNTGHPQASDEDFFAWDEKRRDAWDQHLQELITTEDFKLVK
jgi:hypothetical protein